MIIAVAGGKGGVGKTTVAYNLAAALDAVVIDADLGMADLPVSRGPDLHDVLAGRATPLEAVREDAPVPILPCGRTIAGTRAVEPTRLVRAVDSVADEYGRVVVDCAAGMGGDVGLGLLVARACVLVTTPGRAALSDAVRARALCRELDTGLASVVVNRAVDTPSLRSVEDTLGAPVTAVPESEQVARAQANGVPVTSCAPDSDAARRLRSVAETVQSALSS